MSQTPAPEPSVRDPLVPDRAEIDHVRIDRVVIVGVGGIGGSIAGRLHTAGVPLVLVQRGAHGAAIAQSGLRVREPAGEVIVRAPCATEPAQVRWRPGDVALVATKLQDAEAAFDAILATAGPSVPVVTAQNGVDAETWATQRFRSVWSMLVWVPAVYMTPGEVRNHGAPSPGVLDTGGATERAHDGARALCAVLRRADFDAEPRADILRWKRAKWITNLAGAAQALVTGDVEAVAHAAMDEGVTVLQAAGLDFVPVQELLARCAGVGCEPVGGQGRPGGSTWQSRARGAALECAHLNGALVRLAASVGVEAPVNRALDEAAAAGRDVASADILGR